ncbi:MULTISPECIES: hypothetical protein [Hydrocarboniphaga]|uniref:RNA polymerase alpha subunit C-terminal domain-containing protein n=1 Tax=Hydrocarboniphaga effusa AP103 TaxID=1172194 RepID=I8TAH3_9GAMM|nr:MULTISPECIES: hypothetical protein [Hydrocarboniphaga]EIT70710.1 hypothetical protein WQQ_08470 [Hydrocarboniphaga effusa AP103]MDZ4079914.1 hypothetical protein [Hydrocarboniphaga sp.]
MRARKQRKPHEDWTHGLKTRTANALRAHGFQSKDQVAATPIESLLRIEHFGQVSLADLRTWLLRDERHAGPDAATRSKQAESTPRTDRPSPRR